MWFWDAFYYNEITHETNNPMTCMLIQWKHTEAIKFWRNPLKATRRSAQFKMKRHSIQQQLIESSPATKLVRLHFYNASPLPTSLELGNIVDTSEVLLSIRSWWQNTSWVLSSCSSFQAQIAVGYLAHTLKRKGAVPRATLCQLRCSQANQNKHKQKPNPHLTEIK